MTKMLSTILLACLYLTATSEDIGNDTCPCNIYVNGQGLQVADCRDQTLTTIPDCVLNSTGWLDFENNTLLYLHGQFQRFGELVYLNLRENSDFVAHIDSFRYLYNLEILILDNIDMTFLIGETFLHQTNLRQLSLHGKINVSQGLFEYLENLEKLELGYQRKLVLPNWTFIKLSSLLELKLYFMGVLTLHNFTFYGLTNLKNLNVQDQLVTFDLPDQVFKPLISLEVLHLEGLCGVIKPSLDCTTIDERLRYVPSLKKLFLDKLLISNVGKGFLSLQNLEELYFVNSLVDQTCGIAQIKPETFINLRNSPLRKLVMRNSNINGLLFGWYKYLPKLEEISLSVSTIVDFVFWNRFSTGLENTTLDKVRLSLSSDNPYVIPKPFNVSEGFKHTLLTSLELTDSQFYSVNDNIINKLPKSLKYLNLMHNYISYFGVESLNYLENLETLNLSNQVNFQMQLSTKRGHDIVKYSYEYEFQAQYIALPSKRDQNNVLRVKQLQDYPLNRFNVTNLKRVSLPYRLKTLDLSKSRLLCNMFRAFYNSNNSLLVLNASKQRDRSCFETRVIWSVLNNLVNLEELNLNENRISEIPYDAFNGLWNLRKLTLVDNKLLELSFSVRDLISLETLDLTANSVRYASNSFIGQIEDVASQSNLSLYLNDNPLVCNCKHFDFVAWLKVTQALSNKNRLNCTFENDTYVSIGKISHVHHILKSKCIMLEVTIGCCVTFWGLTLVLGGLAYICHYRQKLKYLVSFGRRTLNPYHPIEDRDVEMEYDVYISFEGDFHVTRDKTLRDFVIHTILKGLEQRRVKVIIREDLKPGRNLYEVISNTVRRSNKVVAFLTNGYCQDMWNVFEFNQAVMEGIHTNRQIAIPVLLESLRHENVKEEICEFLRMEPVSKYSPELSDTAFIDFLYERIRDTRQFG